MSELKITIADSGLTRLFVDEEQVGMMSELVVRSSPDRPSPSVEIRFPSAAAIAQSVTLTEAHKRYLELLRRIPSVVLVDGEEPADESPLVLYFLGTGEDGAGRTLAQVMSRDDSWHERTHDHIQWMLPTRRRSQYEPGAPTLTDADVQAFRVRRDLREAYSFGVDRVKKFLQLDQMCPPWVRAKDHNHKRISRLLESLMDLGMEERAERTLAQVLHIEGMNRGVIDPEAVSHWKRARARRET